MSDDLNTRARKLLNNVERRVAHGQDDGNPLTALQCYEQADQTLRRLEKILRTEDQEGRTKLLLIDVFRISFAALAKDGADLTDALKTVAHAKTQFS